MPQCSKCQTEVSSGVCPRCNAEPEGELSRPRVSLTKGVPAPTRQSAVSLTKKSPEQGGQSGFPLAQPQRPQESTSPGNPLDTPQPAPFSRPVPQRGGTLYRRPRPTVALLVGAALLAVLIGIAIPLALLRSDDGDAGATQTSGGPVNRAEPSPNPEVAAPESELSAPPPSPSSSSETPPPPAPLGIPATYENQPCTGEFVVMLATADKPALYESKLRDAIRGISNAKYLRGDESCDAFLARAPRTRDFIYNAYIGPFSSLQSACNELSQIPTELAWVRRLDSPSPSRSLCMCAESAATLPLVGGQDGADPSELSTRRAIMQVQWLFYLMGRNSRDTVFGTYTKAFDEQVRAYQSDVGLVSDPTLGGRIGTQTWTALKDEFCGNPTYDVAR